MNEKRRVGGWGEEEGISKIELTRGRGEKKREKKKKKKKIQINSPILPCCSSITASLSQHQYRAW